jgi:hypothetical protein
MVTKKKEFFELLDKFLDNDIFKNEQSIKAIQRAHELSSNEDKMIVELHKKLS